MEKSNKSKPNNLNKKGPSESTSSSASRSISSSSKAGGSSSSSDKAANSRTSSHKSTKLESERHILENLKQNANSGVSGGGGGSGNRKKLRTNEGEEGELPSSSSLNRQRRPAKRVKRRSSGETSSQRSASASSSSSTATSSPSSSSPSRPTKKDRNASDSSDSSDRNEKNESKNLNRLSQQLESYKSNLKKTQHRLDKISRALKKARDEGNKSNELKCKKHLTKYRQKVDEIKSKIESYEKRLSQAKREKSSGKATSQTSQPQPQPALPVQQPQMLKLPYPVLNDKRDKTTIYRTLETKLNEVVKKENVNRNNIEGVLRQLQVTSSLVARATLQTQLDKLKQLELNYESQRDKLIKQIEYVRLSINLDELRTSVAVTGGMNFEMPMMAKITQQLTEMVNFMKHENRMYLKSQKAATNEREATPPPANQAPPESPTKAVRQTYESLCKSLVAVLAHTAACAHATAAINAYSQAYYAYLQEQQRRAAGEDVEPVKPPLPLRKELENASHTFEKYKSKISSFFINTKKLENLTKKLSTHHSELSGLNKLVPDYDDDDDDDNNDDHDEKNSESESKKSSIGAHEVVKHNEQNGEERKLSNGLGSGENESGTQLVPVVSVIPSSKQDAGDESDEDDQVDDGWETDMEKKCDLEIVMTSELKSSVCHARNYVVPSLKASYFPLKASRDYSCVVASKEDSSTPQSTIGFEKSNGALTVMGRSGSIVANQMPSQASSRSSLSQILFARR